ncbi:hypothetical protein ASD99_21520 [Mesorhizobium sp. Root695]|nr:hypothetical protein ASD99_21520 [Mesorhizobium sp. Root695]
MKMMNRFGPLSLAVLVWPISSAYGDEATVTLANKSWIAFQCSYYASAMPHGGEEGKRLRQVGYTAGRQYLAAADAGRVNGSEFLNIPRQFTYWGPSHDYILGAVSVFAMDIDGAHGHMNDLSQWAAAEYKKRNCQHLKLKAP